MKANVLRFPGSPSTPSEPAAKAKTKAIPQRIDASGHVERVRAVRDALVVEHLPLVRQIALRVSQSLPPSFDLDDLIATGYLGLISAATRFRPDAHGGTPFSAYARTRIRGAMLDSAKRGRYEENTRPSIDEITTRLDCGIGSDTHPIRNLAVSSAPSVEISIDQARTKKRVREAIAFLPEDQRELIVRRYIQERDGRGSAADFASETHVVAIDALRRRLKAA